MAKATKTGFKILTIVLISAFLLSNLNENNNIGKFDYNQSDITNVPFPSEDPNYIDIDKIHFDHQKGTNTIDWDITGKIYVDNSESLVGISRPIGDMGGNFLSTGTPNYAQINESVESPTVPTETTYVYDKIANWEKFLMSVPDNVFSITNVKLYFYGNHSTVTFRFEIYSGTGAVESPLKTMGSSTSAWYSTDWDVDWTGDEVDSMSVKITQSYGTSIQNYVVCMYAEITYTVLVDPSIYTIELNEINGLDNVKIINETTNSTDNVVFISSDSVLGTSYDDYVSFVSHNIADKLLVTSNDSYPLIDDFNPTSCNLIWSNSQNNGVISTILDENIEISYSLRPTLELDNDYYNLDNIKVEVRNYQSNEFTLQDPHNLIINNALFYLRIYDKETNVLLLDDGANYRIFTPYINLQLDTITFVNNALEPVYFDFGAGSLLYEDYLSTNYTIKTGSISNENEYYSVFEEDDGYTWDCIPEDVGGGNFVFEMDVTFDKYQEYFELKLGRLNYVNVTLYFQDGAISNRDLIGNGVLQEVKFSTYFQDHQLIDHINIRFETTSADVKEIDYIIASVERIYVPPQTTQGSKVMKAMVYDLKEHTYSPRPLKYSVKDIFGNSLDYGQISFDSEGDFPIVVFTPDYYEFCQIGLFDQSGNNLNFEKYKVYVNDSIIYTNSFYGLFGTNWNISVNDHFNQLLTYEIYTIQSNENYVYISITQFSFKIHSLHEVSTFLNLSKDISSEYFSEYISPNEVIEYILTSGNYTFEYYDDSNSLNSIEINLTSDSLLTLNSTYHLINIQYFALDGLGLDSDIARLFINGERKNVGNNLIKGSSCAVSVYDYFDSVLYTQRISTNIAELAIFLPIYTMQISHNFTDTMQICVSRSDNPIKFKTDLPTQSGISLRYLANVKYNIKISYLNGTSAENRTILLNENLMSISFGFYAKIGDLSFDTNEELRENVIISIVAVLITCGLFGIIYSQRKRR
jgi:hypothetical protein